MQAERLRERITKVEEEITRLESENEELQNQLSAAFSSHERSAEILQQMEERKSRIEACEKQWEELSEQLEAGK
jgi:chaperonin cofactor prefoldin